MNTRHLLFPLLIAAGTAAAAESSGERLYQANCVACHVNMVGGDGSALFTRADRRVNSLAGLGQQVRRCKDNLGLTWFDDEVNEVVAFLNAHYYHFKE